MSRAPDSPKTERLRMLPSVDAILRTEAAGHIVGEAGKTRLTEMARAVISKLRRQVAEGHPELSGGDEQAEREALLGHAERMLEESWEASKNLRLQRVVNATGVIVHTNLGRAPLSESARRAMFEEASRYCNLEYDLTTGVRGRRGANAERLVCDVTGAEAAVIVNNCAAATMLVLRALAEGGEAVVSRGELVEIGGDFRIPDVMSQSGVIMREVGTTNRTKTSDYEQAVTAETKLYLRVHTSNFRVIGFTETPTVAELVSSAHSKGVLFYEDAGSGALVDLSEHGLKDEPLIRKSVESGADVVSFSGDKLLGGMQAGIIVGKRDVIERIRKHPLYRAMRVDKFIYVGIQATLESFIMGTHLEEVPVLKMIVAPKSAMLARTERFARKLVDRCGDIFAVEIKESNFVVGGGSAPEMHPESIVIELRHKSLSANELESALRTGRPPVIARIVDDKVVLDLRTVFEDEEDELLEVISGV